MTTGLFKRRSEQPGQGCLVIAIIVAAARTISISFCCEFHYTNELFCDPGKLAPNTFLHCNGVNKY